jgi:hypothetical protein
VTLPAAVVALVAAALAESLAAVAEVAAASAIDWVTEFEAMVVQVVVIGMLQKYRASHGRSAEGQPNTDVAR